MTSDLRRRAIEAAENDRARLAALNEAERRAREAEMLLDARAWFITTLGTAPGEMSVDGYRVLVRIENLWFAWVPRAKYLGTAERSPGGLDAPDAVLVDGLTGRRLSNPRTYQLLAPFTTLVELGERLKELEVRP